MTHTYTALYLLGNVVSEKLAVLQLRRPELYFRPHVIPICVLSGNVGRFVVSVGYEPLETGPLLGQLGADDSRWI